MRIEVSYTQVSERFYSSVVQEVLLFGFDLWVVPESIEISVEGMHTGFLQKIMVNRARKNPDGAWVTPAASAFLEASGMQSEATYIGSRQGVVSQWVEMRPIFEIYARDKYYEKA